VEMGDEATVRQGAAANRDALGSTAKLILEGERGGGGSLKG
jgi:hypothetical protein